MRILITGASGSGTTTLGRALATEMDCAFFDADDYYWMPTNPPFRDKRDQASRLKNLLQDLTQSHAVIAGSIMNWGAELEESLSLVVFLTVPAEIRVARLSERELGRFGRVEPAFLAWAAQYDEGRLAGRSLHRHEHWLAQRGCPVLRIDGDTSIQDRLVRVRALASRPDAPSGLC
jgi:adenylate kinase family enzyme